MILIGNYTEEERMQAWELFAKIRDNNIQIDENCLANGVREALNDIRKRDKAWSNWSTSK